MSAHGWPALVTERLGGWLLQAADGFTGRANSVVPHGDPGLPLEDALAFVERFYARAGLPARIQVAVGSGMEEALRGRGWAVVTSGKEAYATSEVQVARLDEMMARLSDISAADSSAADVELGRTLDESWLGLYGRTTTLEAARHVLASPENVALARVARPPDAVTADRRPELAGIGRGVVTGPWLGVAAVEVSPPCRRRGMARAIMARIGRWGRDLGASWVYLQVGSSNTAAKALYERLGFGVDHHYRYYSPMDG
ncbi:GNAT family N-acetyltransferase [Actinopolymorpha sp. B17G11]|uniref:GNAT family N-acetyltransferase n=1 Tax=unclassified Actinopolymorpha TaxID=2627063 RepID=UPI0032D93F42